MFSHSQPYRDERPSGDPSKSTYQSVQDVDARLWQDPFAALERSADNKPATEKREVEFKIKDSGVQVVVSIPKQQADGGHSADRIFEDIDKTPGSVVTVLAVTLSGAPYPEEAEQRMRRRYAVLSGLANQGRAPIDEQHIGYLEPTHESLQKKSTVRMVVGHE
ncbi:hypothetical protein A1507_14395 [Methylomonas koyamae]|uniref:Uncharacterized protein n=1 Tax=Methylomonas koyamae TaxID=702114 RepID=A0A177NBK9_9GAMM|nr:hypothetical protein [Methylomonas koyamae]OAI15387.1 hypothetical protein A1507_14395 [Methylomonas koyamae]